MGLLDGITNPTGYEFEQTQYSEGQIGKPGVLQSMGLQRIRHNLATEQQNR